MLEVEYSPANRDIVSEVFDDDVIVLNLRNGKYFSFSETGSAVWGALSGGIAPGMILSRVPNIAASDMERFLSELLSHELLGVSEPAMGRTLEGKVLTDLVAAAGRPEMFIYDDLADLFVADPIHDVDEAIGWPALKEAEAN
ncbi:PqqD family protein [Mesorhizobium sp. ES1-1]|uniref:PqqD family protein n=1 Tax=Mesorhizobium sp. ES1-1 TaxID=2876629 RepID=UPI001CC9414E|nr:PqqD family protein [Mesorhizobium sp. ES1-1]MBZ9678791.1 PqqD family protein [Mesorhizobium sp. ES1-1]